MKHWVFDLDGTLVDSFSHYFKALEGIFKQYGVEFTEDLRLPALTHPLLAFFEEHLGKAAVPAAFAKLQVHSNDDAFQGLDAFVRKVTENGAQVGIWTNRDLESAQLILQSTGLSRYSTICVSGDCVAQRKPHPEGLLRIIKLFGCRPDEVTMVGDHTHDVTAAKAIGARSVRASWHQYWAIEKCPHSDHQFYKTSEFEAWALHP